MARSGKQEPDVTFEDLLDAILDVREQLDEITAQLKRLIDKEEPPELFAETIPDVQAVITPEDVSQDEIDFYMETGLPLFDNSDYLFYSQNKKFNATSFVQNHAKKGNKGKWIFEPIYGLDTMLCLFFIASCYVLSEKQVAEGVIKNPDNVKKVLERLMREGLITEIKNTETDERLFCLSRNGLKAFTTETSRKLVESVDPNPPADFVLDCELIAGKYSVPMIRDINEVSLGLVGEVTRFFDRKKYKASHSTLIHKIVGGEPTAILMLQANTGAAHTCWIIGPGSLEEAIAARAKSKKSSPGSLFNYLCVSGGDDSDMKERTKGIDRVFWASRNPEADSLELLDSNGDPVEDIMRALFYSNGNTGGELLQTGEETASKTLARHLLDAEITPLASQESYLELVDVLLQEAPDIQTEPYLDNSLTQALVLLKALSTIKDERGYELQYARLLLALDSRLDEHEYTSEALSMLFSEKDSGTALHLAALLRTLFASSDPYDFTLKSYASDIMGSWDELFLDHSAAKPLFNLLFNVLEVVQQGFSQPILRQLLKENRHDTEMQLIRERALGCADEPGMKTKLRGMPKMVTLCFGPQSDLSVCMKAIGGGSNEDNKQLFSSIYHTFCRIDDGGRAALSEDLIDDYIKENWRVASAKENAKKVELMGLPRRQLTSAVRARLEVIGDWLSVFDETEVMEESHLLKLNALRSKVLDEFDRLIEQFDSLFLTADKGVLLHMLKRLQSIALHGASDNYWEFAELLQTNVFPFNGNALPVIGEEFNEVACYEPWRAALFHIASNEIDIKEALRRIGDKDYPTFYDNNGIAIEIHRYLGLDTRELQKLRADSLLDDSHYKADSDQFRATLDQALAYGRIGEDFREDLVLFKESLGQTFIDSCDYGCYRAFLLALEASIDNQASRRQKELLADIDKRASKRSISDIQREILDRATAKLSAPEQNFVVAEELINRFDSRDVVDCFFEDPDDPGEFSRFIDADYFEELRGTCADLNNKQNALRSFGIPYVEERLEAKGVSKQYHESAQQLLESVPSKKDAISPSGIRNLLEEIGFKIADTKNAISHDAQKSKDRLFVYTAEVVASPRDKAEYLHPVDIFGTKLHSPIYVVLLFGNPTPHDIIERVCGLELNSTALVFMDGFLDINNRRQLAELFHDATTGLYPFLFIDRILLLHLALHERSQRMPLLLSCALPYTSSFQPFVMMGSVSDEMFIGRKKELRMILDPKGPAIVYGGRQLGKTALLERARSLANQPKNKQYAVFLSVFCYEDESRFVEELVGKLLEQGLRVKKHRTVEDLCGDLKVSYGSEWKTLTLLIDEADALLASFQRHPTPYEPINSLLNLKRDTNNDFKFVFAGLHNVCRAANDPNSVFGQLGSPLCIKPLSPPDSLQLLTKPLRYLGFVFEEGKLEHLLVNTNFYPGIIHYVGFSLVENLMSHYRQFYKGSDCPPYSLTEKQLGSIISNESLNERIDERIKWTLEVDARYFMLARCIAYLYYEYPDQARSGYPVNQILECAKLLSIVCLAELSFEECETLLTELVGMGILVKVGKSSYRLRQYRFLNVIGKDTETIENAIQQESQG